jgi:hypothetical protein
MSTKYQGHYTDHHNVVGNENTNHHAQMKSGGTSSGRMPLRSRQVNTENNAHNKMSTNTKGPSVSKSSRSSRSKNAEETAPLEIEELRRKPNGEGHTVHRYTRGKLLGKGGFAKVYMCTSMDTNRTYAVKIVPKANLVKSRARQKVRFIVQLYKQLLTMEIWLKCI